MASFKRLKRSDIISVPYIANKNWVLEYYPLPLADQNIKIYKGTNITGSFSNITDPITEGQYERLIYSQFNHLYYQTYSSNNELLNTSSLVNSLYFDGASQIRATGSYIDYNDNPLLIKNYPTGSNEGIRVLSIDKKLYGEQLLPYSFNLSSSEYYIKDDGIGNLIDTSNSNTHVGNIFYSHGLAIITNQDYQLMWPIPPLAKYIEVNYLDTDSSRIINVSSSIELRNNTDILNTGSLILSDSSSFIDNINGTITFDSNADLGVYYTNYTYKSNLSNSIYNTPLISNQGLIKINIISNCNFSISSSEYIFPLVTSIINTGSIYQYSGGGYISVTGSGGYGDEEKYIYTINNISGSWNGLRQNNNLTDGVYYVGVFDSMSRKFSYKNILIESPTYNIIPKSTIVNEGDNMLFEIRTSKVPNGTTLYWTNSGTSTSSDFVDNTNSGSFIINNGTGSVTRSISNDLTTEYNETFVLNVRVDSTSGYKVATSEYVFILDTSKNPITPTPTPTPTIPTVQLKLSSNYSDPCTTNNTFMTYYLKPGDTLFTIDGSDGHTVYQDYALTTEIPFGIYTDGINGFQLAEGGNYNTWVFIGACSNIISPPNCILVGNSMITSNCVLIGDILSTSNITPTPTPNYIKCNNVINWNNPTKTCNGNTSTIIVSVNGNNGEAVEFSVNNGAYQSADAGSNNTYTYITNAVETLIDFKARIVGCTSYINGSVMSCGTAITPTPTPTPTATNNGTINKSLFTFNQISNGQTVPTTGEYTNGYLKVTAFSHGISRNIVMPEDKGVICKFEYQILDNNNNIIFDCKDNYGGFHPNFQNNPTSESYYRVWETNPKHPQYDNFQWVRDYIDGFTPIPNFPTAADRANNHFSAYDGFVPVASNISYRMRIKNTGTFAFALRAGSLNTFEDERYADIHTNIPADNDWKIFELPRLRIGSEADIYPNDPNRLYKINCYNR